MGVLRNRIINLERLAKAVALVVLLAGAVVMLMPLIWMIMTSLKSFTEVLADPPTWLPRKFLWQNYLEAMTSFKFSLYLRNSMIVVSLYLMGTFLSASMAAYAFARLRVKKKNILFMLLLATMMLPPQITIIPVFKLYATFGWVNTLYPLFVPAWLGVNVFAIFLLRQFFLTIPQDYIDAARMDGANEFTILFRLFIPLSKPAVLTILVLSFIGSWNDLWNPLVFIHNENLYTLPVALIAFLSTTIEPRGVQWQLMMAASTIIIIPLIIVFFLAQRYFIEGITMTGLKA